jgi:hypothetical protein
MCSKLRVSKTNSGVSSPSKHKGSGPTMVRKIVAVTSTTKAGLGVSTMPALKSMVVAFTMGVGTYSYGGYWFYAGAYPTWFYRQEVYFIMGTNGLWYAVAYDNPSLTFQVNIE